MFDSPEVNLETLGVTVGMFGLLSEVAEVNLRGIADWFLAGVPNVMIHQAA